MVTTPGETAVVMIDFLLLDPQYTLSLLSRRGQLQWLGIRLWVASPEDMLVLKLVANREKDILDAKKIYQRQPSFLDMEYVHKWADYFKCGEAIARLKS